MDEDIRKPKEYQSFEIRNESTWHLHRFIAFKFDEESEKITVSVIVDDKKKKRGN